jgi:hypothetical protein
VKAYGEVGVPKDTPGRSKKTSDMVQRTIHELYAIFGYVHETNVVHRRLLAVTNGKDQARAIVDEWNRTKVGPGQTFSLHSRDIETVRHYKFGEKVTFHD